MTQENKFVTFGCWNCRHEKCKNELIVPMDNVIDKIKNDYKLDSDGNSPLNYIIVSGDNYYPLKTDKISKTINTDELREGIKKLSEISPEGNPPIFMIMGNHDLEPTIGDSYIFTPQIEIQPKCGILSSEKKSIDDLESKITYLPRGELLFGEKTLILMIDTSIYDEDEIDELIMCYEPGETKESLRLAQKTFVLDKIDNGAAKNIIIIGHHPIMGVKQTEEKTDKKTGKIKPAGQKITTMKPFIDFWSELPTDKGLDYYYLCADVHLYQEGTVTLQSNGLQINQYVAGTGGAEKDSPPPNGTYTEEGVVYEINKSKKSYGFLECKELDGSLTFDFKSSEQLGGAYNKKGRKTTKKKRRVSNKLPKRRTAHR